MVLAATLDRRPNWTGRKRTGPTVAEDELAGNRRGTGRPMTAVASHADRALAEANKIRSARAVLRREVHALPPAEGIALVADLLRYPPGHIASMRVFDLLGWPAKVGPIRVGRWWRGAGLPPDKRVADLTARQAEAVAEILRR